MIQYALIWSVIKYVSVVVITIITTSYVTGREVGKHLSEIQTLREQVDGDRKWNQEWRNKAELKIDELQAVSNYLLGKINGSSFGKVRPPL